MLCRFEKDLRKKNFVKGSIEMKASMENTTKTKSKSLLYFDQFKLLLFNFEVGSHLRK